MKVVIIDNYDSFTYNLYQQIGTITGQRPDVFRNDEITLPELERLRPTHIVLSPGPGHPSNPRDFGVCKNVITESFEDIPVLGICLGHQGIIAHLGGNVVHAPSIVHGKMHTIEHNNEGLFQQLPTPLKVMRYHSLIGDRSSLPETLRVTAWTSDQLIMAIQHNVRPLFGLQFHPESVGTPDGDLLIRNFLNQ
ncbi:MAG: aminodeoxychorismate/anthranilate synthase component II [Myxococcota bacterium]|nr:aminodeoxychorismate/anthranilate synthase component II [Myxococcota bacterium]